MIPRACLIGLVLTLITLAPATCEPLYVAIVWHNHQGINVWPNAVFHGPWAFVHTYRDEFKPYFESGAYLVHAELLLKHPGVKVTMHLSPSLLWQWDYGLRHGFLTQDGSYVPPNDPRLDRVRRALEAYKKLAEEGRVEIISSFFNHPIPGYVASSYGWGTALMAEELKWGTATTRRVLGVRTRGAWTPEMSFSMKLLPAYCSAGVAYTVLDGRYHFAGAKGDKGTIYEPYLLRAGNCSLVVFFRDSDISDFIGFEVKPRSPEEARQLAEDVVSRLLRIRREHPEARVVVIALDGENWMFSGPETAVFLDALYGLLEDNKELRTATLSEVLDEVPPRRVLTSLPTTSWAGGHWVWTSRAENAEQWKLIEGTVKALYEVEAKYGRDSLVYREALFAAFMVLNSDVIHREYTFVHHTRAWASELKTLLKKGEDEAKRMASLGLNFEAEGRGPRSLGEAGPVPIAEEKPYSAAIWLAAVVLVVAAFIAARRLLPPSQQPS